MCNFRCVQCPTGMDDYAEAAGYYQAMPMDLYAKVIGDLQEIGQVKSIKMYLMGEPLLNKNLGKMIAMAREAGVSERIEVTSNCSMLTRARAIELLDSGLEYLRVSIYSVDEEKHSEITKSKFTPAQVFANVKQLRALRDERGLTRPFINAEMLSVDDAANQRFLDTYKDVVDEATITYPHNWNGYEELDLITVQTSLPGGRGSGQELSGEEGFVPVPVLYAWRCALTASVVTCCVDWSGGDYGGDVQKRITGGEFGRDAACWSFKRCTSKEGAARIPHARIATLSRGRPIASTGSRARSWSSGGKRHSRR